MSAVSYEAGGGTLRANEKFGCAYDEAGNPLQWTNNTLIQMCNSDNGDGLVNVSRNNSLLTVAGGVSNAPTALRFNGQGAAVYCDLTFAVGNERGAEQRLEHVRDDRDQPRKGGNEFAAPEPAGGAEPDLRPQREPDERWLARLCLRLPPTN